MDRIDALEALVATADAGTFAAAGRRIGRSRDQISKAVAELEARVNLQLVHRTTRRAVLTDAGTAYVQQVRPLLEGLRAAEAHARERNAGPSGRLVVNAPLTFGLAVLSPLVHAYLDACPEVDLDLRLDDRPIEPIPDDVDITIRLASAVDTDQAVQVLGRVERALYAAPRYLARHGRPGAPEALAQHECLVYGHLATGVEWVLRRLRDTRRIAIAGRLACNSGALLAAAAAAGRGIATLPDFVAAPLLARHRLERVLPEWAAPPLHVHALAPPARAGSPRVRSFIEFIRPALGR